MLLKRGYIELIRLYVNQTEMAYPQTKRIKYMDLIYDAGQNRIVPDYALMLLFLSSVLRDK